MSPTVLLATCSTRAFCESPTRCPVRASGTAVCSALSRKWHSMATKGLDACVCWSRRRTLWDASAKAYRWRCAKFVCIYTFECERVAEYIISYIGLNQHLISGVLGLSSHREPGARPERERRRGGRCVRTMGTIPEPSHHWRGAARVRRACAVRQDSIPCVLLCHANRKGAFRTLVQGVQDC